jgi:hypothetical protein
MTRKGVPRCLTLALATAACGEPPTEPSPPEAVTPSFAVASNTWITRANLPGDSRANVIAATVTNARGQSVMYVFGGSRIRADGRLGARLPLVQAYNAATNTWTSKTPRSFDYATHGAEVIDGKVYIAGGFLGYTWFSWELRVYDPASDTWSYGRNVPVPGYAGVTGVLSGKLYLLARCINAYGCDVEEYLPPNDGRFFGFYDPATDTWTKLTPPPSGADHRYGVGGMLGGRFYVVGGYGNEGLEIYDPATKQWSTGPAPPASATYATSATVAGKLYVFTGDTTERYDPVTNTWSMLTPPPRSADGLTAARVLVNGRPRIELVGGPRVGSNMQYIP